MSVRRRYEILVPLQFNNGGAVPEALLGQWIEGLELEFDTVSWESQVARAIGQDEGTVYRENNTRLILDVEDSPRNRARFTGTNEILKQRFGQHGIWLTSHLVDVV